MCASTPGPMLLWWGSSFTELHNDAAIPELDRLNSKYPTLRDEVARVRETGAITARDQPSDIQKSVELGFAEHFVKPVDIVELDRLVRLIAL